MLKAVDAPVPPPPQSPPPQARLIQMLEGFWLARAASVAANLRLADPLAAGPMTVDQLAAATNTHAPTLGRLVRALCAYGLFAEGADGRVGLTDVGGLLASDRPGTMQALIATLMGGEHYAAWGALEESIRTGQTAFDHHYGMDVWAFYRQNPALGEAFNRTMVAATAAVNEAIAQAYSFRRFAHVVDVGGGHGSLLRLALEQNSAASGTLFDQPHVVAEAKASLAAAGLAGRVTTVGGSFFDAIPAGGDAYLLKYILHDWDDDRCETILRNVRQAIAPNGTLLVFDTVIPTPPRPDLSVLMDLNMLAMTGGRERSEPELRGLLGRCGFRLTGVIPTQSHVAIAEAAPI